MMRSCRSILLCLAAAAGLLASACAMHVEGKVYLDVNGNRNLEETESGLTGIVLTVSQGNKVLGQVVSEEKGKYDFEVPKAGQGAYTVKAQKTSLLRLPLTGPTTQTNVPPAALSALETEGGGTAGESTAGETSETQPDGGTSSGGAGGTNTGSTTSEVDHTLKQDAGSLSASRDCTGSGNCEIDLAISPQYEGTIQKMVVPPTRKMTLGEVASAAVCYPSRCILEPIVFPSCIELVPGLHAFNPTTREVVIRLTQRAPTGTIGLPGGEVSCEPMQVRLTTEAVEDCVVEPTAICPDTDTSLKLPRHTFQPIRVPDVAVAQRMTGDSVLGSTILVEATATNNGDTNLPGAKLVLTLPNFTSGVNAPGCNNLGQKVECIFDLAAAGGAVVRPVSFTLPAAITQDTTFTVATTLNHPALPNGSVAAESIQFSIAGPPRPQDNQQ